MPAVQICLTGNPSQSYIVLEQKKDKASISVIEAEKENLSRQIEDNITKIYNLQF